MGRAPRIALNWAQNRKTLMRRFASLIATALAVLSLSACQKPVSAVTDEDMSLGDPQAKVTVIEYASASCPHCARFNNDVFPAFKAKYIDTGKIRYVFREFLTPPAEVAAAGFLTARCAGKDKYFSLLDAIYRGQQAMFESGDIRGSLLRIAQSAGLSESQFNTCVSDDTAIKALNDRVNKYIAAGIESTPTFVVNGKQLVGEQSLATMDAAIAAAQKGG
jgi:protein-disulfide isomerase